MPNCVCAIYERAREKERKSIETRLHFMAIYMEIVYYMPWHCRLPTFAYCKWANEQEKTDRNDWLVTPVILNTQDNLWLMRAYVLILCVFFFLSLHFISFCFVLILDSLFIQKDYLYHYCLLGCVFVCVCTWFYSTSISPPFVHWNAFVFAARSFVLIRFHFSLTLIIKRAIHAYRKCPIKTTLTNF